MNRSTARKALLVTVSLLALCSLSSAQSDHAGKRTRLRSASPRPLSQVASTGPAAAAKVPYRITTIAGNNPGNLPATSLALGYPLGLAFDKAGNLYIADNVAQRVWLMNAAGQVSVFAGNGAGDFDSLNIPPPVGDNGLAVNAQLLSPSGVAVDGAGNVYITEFNGNRVRKVKPSTGIISTFVTGLNGPDRMTIDAAGNLYVAEKDGNQIAQITPTGVITRIVGTGLAGYSGDNGPATSATLSCPEDVALDPVSGNLLIADTCNGAVRLVTLSSGLIQTVAVFDDFTNGIRTDSIGAVYVTSGSSVFLVYYQAPVLVAGTGTTGYGGDGGPPQSALLNLPTGLAFDASGNLYIADSQASLTGKLSVPGTRVRKISSPSPGLGSFSSGPITTVLGGGSEDGRPANQANIYGPQGLAVDASGNIYFAADCRIRRINRGTGLITTVGGNGDCGTATDGVLATSTALGDLMSALAIDSAGNIYFSDTDESEVRRIDAITHILTTFNTDNFPSFVASAPWGIALDGAGNVYFADNDGDSVHMIPAGGGNMVAIAGTDFTPGYSGDGGPATSATLNAPTGIALDRSGNLYILDSGNHVIRRVDARTRIITTVADLSGFDIGFDDDFYSGAVSDFNGLALDGAGNLFVSTDTQILRVDASTKAVTLIAGSLSGEGFTGDNGVGTSALMADGYGIAVTTSGVVLFSDLENNRVRELTPMLSITAPCPAPTGIQDLAYSFPITTSGGAAPLTWTSIGGALPIGLTLDPSTGVISGAPTAAGTFPITIRVTDGTPFNPQTATYNCAIVIIPALTITTACPITATSGTALGVPLTAVGGIGSYAFSVIGGLPPNLTLFGNVIQGLVTAPPGNYFFTLQVTDGQQTVQKPCGVIVNPPPLQITSACPSSPIMQGASFGQPLTATGGTGSNTWSIIGGGLPNGLTLTGNSISGTPTGPPGTSNFTIQVSSGGQTATLSCSLTVAPPPLQLTSACPGNGTQGGSYGPFTLGATGGLGVGTYTFSIQGTLPPGVTFSGNTIGGTPTTSGAYSFSVSVTSGTQTITGPACSITIAPPPLQITSTCPAATLNLPLTLSVPLTATGGQSPYSWSLSGPSWLGLSSSAGSTTTVTAGTPTYGPFSFTVTLTDSANSAAASFSCSSSINAPVIPPITIVITPPSTPLQPVVIAPQLTTPAPLPLTGIMQLTFIPNAFGITDNPQVYFDGGGRTASFTIAAGQTSFSLPNIQEGTVAGTIHLEIVNLMQGTNDVLSAPHPFADLVVPRQAPAIGLSDITFANETPNGFDIVISGYSTPRDMMKVILSFAASQGASIDGTASYTIDVSGLFAQYYSSPASQLAGSMWQNLHIPITVAGDKTAIGSVSVTLTNSAGNSQMITKTR